MNGREGRRRIHQGSWKTEITQLVEIRSETPGELEMNREGRKKLEEELMMEYPTRQDNQEEEKRRGDAQMQHMPTM